MKKRTKRTAGLVLLLGVVLLLYAALKEPTAATEVQPDVAARDSALAAMFVSMNIDDDFVVRQRENNFLRLSSEGVDVERSICVYTYPGDEPDTARVLAMRDSVMKRNVKGEQPSMYMATERRLPTKHSRVGEHFLRTEGRWEMENDMMGGPFVSYSLRDEERHRIVVAEAFLYAPAPESDPTAMMKHMEAMLGTLKIIRPEDVNIQP